MQRHSTEGHLGLRTTDDISEVITYFDPAGQSREDHRHQGHQGDHHLPANEGLHDSGGVWDTSK